LNSTRRRGRLRVLGNAAVLTFRSKVPRYPPRSKRRASRMTIAALAEAIDTKRNPLSTSLAPDGERRAKIQRVGKGSNAPKYYTPRPRNEPPFGEKSGVKPRRSFASVWTMARNRWRDSTV